MRNLIIPLCIITLISLAGCDNIDFDSSGRYSGEKDAAGNFLILDTRTGKVEALKNGQLFDILKEKDIEQVKTYPSRNISGMPIQLGGLRLKFRDGRLLYKGYMSPIASTSQEGKNIPAQESSVLFKRMEALWKGALYTPRNITIYFSDSDDFNIISLKITKGAMTRTVDNKGNPIRLSFVGSEAISPNDFQSISGYSFSWNLANWKETAPKKKKNG